MKHTFPILFLFSLPPAGVCFGKELPVLKSKLLIEKPKEGWDYFFSGCSWYCGAPKITVSATSQLEEADNLKYPANQAHDHKMATVWNDGVPGNGEGEKLTLTFTTTKKDTKDLGVTSCSIASGHQASRELFPKNSRPKRLELGIDGKAVAVLDLEDLMGLQRFEIPKLKLERPSNHTLSLKILEVYPGSKYQDTCVSEVYFLGTGVMH